MAGELEVVQSMSSNPGSCLLCGCTPVDETKENRPPLPAIHAIGIDVNWGEDVYICWNCVGLMADMADRPSNAKVQKVIGQAKFQKKRADKAEKKLATLQTRVRELVAGKKAVKALKEEMSNG